MADEENTPPPPPPDPNPTVPPVEAEPVLESPEASDDYIVEEETPQDLEMNRGPAVGTGPTRALITGFVLLVVMGIILWSLFSGKSEAPITDAKNIPTIAPATDIVATPTPPPPAPVPLAATTLSNTPSVPPVPPPPPPPAVPPLPPPPPKFTGGAVTTLPPPPKPYVTPPAASTPGAPSLPIPGAPPLPVPGAPPSVPNVDTLSPIATGGEDQNRQTRLRSNMLIMDSGNEAKGADANANNALNARDANTAFQNNVLKTSKADKERATRLGNLNITVAQGKIINAVMETAVNTDLPGPLRAIVSRDVYTESGREIAVPKGSRLIGVYNSSILRGQSRVLIIWTRILRPDGIDIMVGSPGVDSLGRAGIYGITDNKYSEIFSAAMLTSVITIGIAAGAQAISGDQSTTTSNSNGTTTTGDAASVAASSSVSSVGNIGKSIVDSMLDLKPTITVDQGTLINVFVNKDLTFPISSSGTQFIE
jgi:type IV secretion system protein VirB10